MIDFKNYFDIFCNENNLEISLGYEMPEGYETANGMFDITNETLYINQDIMRAMPEYEQLFYLFHELRHALQYLHPEQYGDIIRRSRFYVIMYNGICYKRNGEGWLECKLEGTEAYLKDVYLGQPYEIDANEFAYEKVKALLGDSASLRELHDFWMPKVRISDAEYNKIYSLIDENAR